MAKNKRIVVPFRRKMEGKTDYRKRLSLLKSDKLRLVVRKTTNNIQLQIVEYSEKGDNILVTANSSELKALGWKCNCGNLPAAYLTGLLIASKAAEKKVGECILDTGFYSTKAGNKVYAALKGAVDGGLNVPHSEKILPAEERINGTQIEAFAKLASENKDKYPNQFSKADSKDITKQFEAVKKSIEGNKK